MITLDAAYAFSKGLRNALADTCHSFELAGALRRGELEFTEFGALALDFVTVPIILPQPGEEEGLRSVEKNLLVDAIEGLDQSGDCTLLQAFPYQEHQLNKLSFSWGIARLWVATPKTFGSVLLYRTGPRAHTDGLCTIAHGRGLCWVPYAGLSDGLNTVGASETEIYTELGLPFIRPARRSGLLTPEAKAL